VSLYTIGAGSAVKLVWIIGFSAKLVVKKRKINGMYKNFENILLLMV
jgi:hypothetical protein